jgi:PAS domain S-box-containing protein
VFPHFQNAVQLLAIIIERIEQNELLNNQKAHLQQLVDQQTRELIKSHDELNVANEELASTNEELIETNRSLLESNRILFDEIRKREQAEEEKSKIRLHSEFFKTALDKIPSYVYLKDAQGKYIYANQHTLNLFKCTIDELIGKSDFDFFEEDFAKELREIDQRIINSRVDSVAEVQGAAKEGEPRYYLEIKTPVIDKQNPQKAIGVCGISTDISPQKAMERKLLENNTLLTRQNNFIHTILDNLPIGLALNDTESGKATYMNRKFQGIYGWGSHEITSIESFFEKVYPDENYRKKLIERVMPDIQSGDPERMHWENIEVTHKNGTKRIVNAVNIPLADHNAMVSTVMDVTDLKKAEEELSKINDLLSKFISNSPIYAFIKEVTETESRVVKVSENYVEMIGFTAHEMVGKTMHELFPPEFAAKITRDDWEVASSGKMIVIDEELNEKHYTTYKFPITEGDKILLAGYTIDISEHKRLTNELIRAKEKAEESDRLKSAFLANMSHEIRTPMNSIMGFASLLPDEESKELMCQYANIIVRNSEQLVHIIDDIVLYSRLQAKILNLNIQQFSIGELLCDLKQSFSLPDYNNGVELIVENQPDTPLLINTDYEKLRQIFMNLISNAYKYTHKGSIVIGAKVKNNRPVLFVKDNVIGIHEGETEKLFERFYRGSNTRKESVAGTGLD